ncbi:restriction endonuclease subunit S [Acinetobacter baumannii]|nr:restriction endonuclease subunit S [Acinetobacter baumannii]
MVAPKLRFKEFDHKWDQLVFSDVFSFYNTNSYSRALLDDKGEIMNIHYGDIHTKFSMLFDVRKEQIPYLGEEIDKKKIREENFLKIGDLVIADASEDYKDIGKAIEVINLDNKKVVAGLHTYIARPTKPCAIGFNGYLMQTANIRSQIQKLATGISVLGISKTNISKIQLCLPSEAEQTKIASFLSAVDEKISQLTQKHQLLSQYKQGMMQKLFSQQIRFKADDGSEFEEWEEKQLGDVCHFINGRAYKQTEWEKEGTPVIRLQNLTGSGKEYYYSTLNLPDHQYCYNNDLLYMWSATFGPIFWQGEKAIFHYHIWKVEVEPKQLDKQYMYYLLDEMTEKMKSSLNGSTMLHVTKQGMESTKKNLPSIEEQTKIANFLSTIDQKIDVASEQLEQAKLWKKGLLQQMFV